MRAVRVSRYHPLLVILHWLLAVLIVGLWCIGFFLLTAMSNTDPQKIGILLIHMAVGMMTFGLMLIRLIVRLSTANPADPTTGHPALDRLAPLVHYGFYVVVLLLPATGLATSVLAGLNRSVFQHSGEPLPLNFDIYPDLCGAHLSRLAAGRDGGAAHGSGALSSIPSRRRIAAADMVRAA